MVSGLMDFSAYGVLTEEPLTGAEMHDLIAAAHDLGFAVMAHCNGAKAVKNAVTAEVDSIEHGAYLDDEACHILAESDTVWVPTLSTIGNLIGSGRFPDDVAERILRSAQENIQKSLTWAVILAWGVTPERFGCPMWRVHSAKKNGCGKRWATRLTPYCPPQKDKSGQNFKINWYINGLYGYIKGHYRYMKKAVFE